MIHQPTLNAGLNSLSAVLLVSGFIYIRLRKVGPHKFCMLAATGTSSLFLISYLHYHYFHGSTRFQGQGLVRTVYFAILLTHTFLAAVQVPLIYQTLRHAFAGRIESHKRWARVTWPIWVYVSITGVVIYWMLYRITY